MLEDPRQADADLDDVLHEAAAASASYEADDEETVSADEIKDIMARVKRGKAMRIIAEARDAATQAKHWDAAAKKLQAEYEDPNYHPVKPSVGNLALRREWQLKAYNLYVTALQTFLQISKDHPELGNIEKETEVFLGEAEKLKETIDREEVLEE